MKRDHMTIYMKKSNPRQLDMRYKNNKEFLKMMDNGRFWNFMQSIAIKLGSPQVFGTGHLTWKLYFNPLYHIRQWYLIRKL